MNSGGADIASYVCDETSHPTSSLGHPSEREKIIARTRPLKIGFPLSRGERVDRAARLHQRAREGGPTFCWLWG